MNLPNGISARKFSRRNRRFVQKKGSRLSGVLGGRKRATLRMKSRDWNEQATEFVNAAYEIGVEPGDIQLQLTVLGYNLEISFP